MTGLKDAMNVKSQYERLTVDGFPKNRAKACLLTKARSMTEDYCLGI